MKPGMMRIALSCALVLGMPTMAWSQAGGGMGSGMGGAQGRQGMQGMQGMQMGTMPSMAEMMQRADMMAQHLQHLSGDAAHQGGRGAMPMEHGGGDPMQGMAGQLHSMATGLHGLLQQMDKMQKAGMKLDRDAERDWTAMHQRANAMLGDLEKMTQAMERLQKRPPSGRP